jgi:glycerol uptake facilitator protein
VLDETSLPQRVVADFVGTAFLVFVGVGAVPATLVVNGDAPSTMADPGIISLTFATVVATVHALGHVSGNHINPAVTRRRGPRRRPGSAGRRPGVHFHQHVLIPR